MDVSAGWHARSLRQLARVNYGRSPADILSVEGRYPVFGTAGPERMGSAYLYDGESVVLGRKGTIGKVHYANGKFWTIDTAYYLSDFRGAVPLWLFYALQTFNLEQLNEATGVPSLSRETLYQLQVRTPPEIEQEHIAEVLSAIDVAIEQAHALIAKQRRIAAGLMDDLFACGVDAKGQLRSQESHEFQHIAGGRIPCDWNASTLGQMGTWHSGGTPSKANPAFWGGDVPWLCPKDMKSFELATTAKTLTRAGAMNGSRIAPAQSVFIVVRGMILAHTFPVTIGSIPMAFNQDVKAIVAANHVEPRFLAYWLVAHSHRVLKITTTATHGTKRFDMAELFSVPIGLPEKDEQQEIVQRVDAIWANIAITTRESAKLRSLRAGLMQDLLTGRVRITPLLKEAVQAVEQVF
jgi:type I restriction enzyme, S subunit